MPIPFHRAAAIALACFTVGAFAQGEDFVGVSIGDDGAPRVSYHFPGGTTLRFTGESSWTERVREPWWKRDRECFKLQGQDMRLGDTAQCAGRSVRLDWDEKARDRMYPALVHLRNGGVLVYAGYLGVATRDDKSIADFVITAPKGGVVAFHDRKSATELRIDGATFEHNMTGWFYFGPDRFVEEKSARVLVDDGVPPEASRIMNQLSPRLMELYATRLGKPYPRRPVFYLAWNGRDEPGRSWQADVVHGGDIRFGLAGKGWAHPDRDTLGAFAATVAHEMAHLWNSDLFGRDEESAPWIHEGNSELVSVAALLALGEIDANEAASRIASATFECQLLAGSRPWKSMWERRAGRPPYTCGLAMQFAISAAARRDHPGLDALAYWRELWRTTSTYDEGMFENDARRRGDAALAGAIESMLTGATPLPEALAKLREMGGITTRAPDTAPATLNKVAARQLMHDVMAADCGGSVSYWTLDDHFHLEWQNGMSCRTLKSGTDVVKIQGLDAFKEPKLVATSLARSCAGGGKMTITTRDGNVVDMPCSGATPDPAIFAPIAFDPAQVAGVLGSAKPRDGRRAQSGHNATAAY